MRASVLLPIVCLLFIQGCVPRAAVVHDGLKTIVVDSVTQAPLDGAFVFDRLEGQAPHVLAVGNEKGEILLDPRTRITMSGFMGEALVFQHLWVCKEGYAPQLAGSRGGWNADYGPSVTYTPKVIELKKSPMALSESCAAIKH